MTSLETINQLLHRAVNDMAVLTYNTHEYIFELILMVLVGNLVNSMSIFGILTLMLVMANLTCAK